MTEYEVPKKPLYNGEASCPFSRSDFFARRQWFFEKHYAESRWNWDIPFWARFHFTNGIEQYLYFRGGDECPSYFKGSDAETWWNMEYRHWLAAPDAPYVEPFVIFFRNWCDDVAAGEFGVNLETHGNPWLDHYLKEAPL